ncbi:hypothetical protein [Bosea sp. (in: a-proteobacteria)]|jgi:hypothetical protein|uniref:hypothetical protein n=1 Tax=Bosea sp. (in: a-proteobacteria) TaxID=1871050 RepID=UPI003569EB1F
MSATPLELFLSFVATVGAILFIYPFKVAGPNARPIGFAIAALGIGGFLSLSRSPPVITATSANVLAGSGDRQQLFIQAVERGRAAYAAGANEMAKGGARPARAKEICAALADIKVSGWTGVVRELSSNSHGKGVLSVDIGQGILLGTTTIDFGDWNDTLIAPGSALFQKAAALAPKQRVSFSGLLVRNDVDCVQEKSLTLAGSMKAPEFLFKFTDLSPL